MLTLALGIAATTAMFSVVDAALLRRAPYPGIERFAEVRAAQPGPFRMAGIAGVAMPSLRQGLAGVAAVEGYQMGSATVTGGREPDIVGVPSITPNLLSFIGATVEAGRLFNETDLESTARHVIISHNLWTTNFGSDPGVIGRIIELDDEPHTIVGLMSRRVRYPEANAAIWKPLSLEKASQSRQRVQVVTVRAPGVSEDEFAARLKSVEAALKEAKLLTDGQTLESDILSQERFARADSRSLWLMFGAVTLVLLVACVNVSNLLLARASRQHGEAALRTALGASRSQLLGVSFAESIVLSFTGGAAGVALAYALLAALRQILPPQMTYFAATSSEIDVRVLMFAVGLSFITAIVSGLVPALRASSVDPIDAMKQHSASMMGARNEWWQASLLAAQLSLVLVLLAGAGLLLRSFLTLSNVDPGFRSAGLTLVHANITSSRYANSDAGAVLMQELEQRLESSGQMKVTIATGAPVFGVGVYGNITPEAEGGIARDFTGQILPRVEVAPDYFETLGIRIEQGRAFTVQDGKEVVVVNDKLAAYFWGDASPVGRRFRTDTKTPWFTVVGVAADVRQMGLNDPLSHGMELYFPNGDRIGAGGAIIVRSDRPSAEVINTVKQTLWSLDPRIPVTDAMSMDERIGESLYRQRFFVRLSIAFTVIATLLAMIGVYGN
ncbi:MAG TPA: ABC transporter permease, partial [Vicinamibacterales bacterium]